MAAENIIAINAPNGVSITVMLLFGVLALAFVKKLIGGKLTQVSTGPAFTGG